MRTSQFSRNQQLFALLAVKAGWAVAAVSRVYGISRMTYYRWQAELADAVELGWEARVMLVALQAGPRTEAQLKAAATAMGVGYVAPPEPRAAYERRIAERLRELGKLKRTWGYRRLHELLEAEGFRHGLKRTYRLYIAEGLPVRRERAKTSRIGRVGKRVPPTRPNEVWEMVAVRVVLQNEQTYRAWRLGDAFTGELLDLQLDHLFRETPSTRAFDALLASQGPPTALWVDGDVCHLKSINGWASRNHLPVHRVPGRAAAFADVFPAEPFSLRREAEAGLWCNIKPYLEQS